MHLAYATRLIARKLPVVLLLGLLGLGAGFVAAKAMQSYSTTAYLSMSPARSQQGIRAVDPERFFQTQSQLVVSDEVMKVSAKALGNGMSPEELREHITLGGGATDDIMRVTVEGDDEATSWARAEAVLKGIESAPQDEVVTKLLWTGEPTPGVDTKQLLIGGLLGGLALGTLAVLLAGAVRRPAIDPRFVQVSNPQVAVYPRRVSAEQAEMRPGDALTGWLQAHNPQRLPMVVVPVDSHEATSRMELALPTGDAVSGTTGRFIVYVATASNTTEGHIDEAINSVQGPADQAVLLLTDPKISHEPFLEARRAAVSPALSPKE